MAITLQRKAAEEEERKRKAAKANKFLEDKSKRDQAARDKARDKAAADRRAADLAILQRPTTPEPRPQADFGFAVGKGGATEFAGEGAARERGVLSRNLERQRQDMIANETAAKEAESRPDIDKIASEAIANVQITGDVEKDKLSYEQAFKSALSTAGVSAASAATIAGGAALLSPAAPAAPLIAAGAAGVVGVAGFIAAFRSNLKTQRTDMVKGESQNLMKTEQNMLKQVMLMNQLPRLGGSTDDLVEIKTMFDEQMALTDENHERLILETNDDLSKWLGEDGHKQLEKYENFNNPGGMREILIKQMTLAINSPDLGRIEGLQSQVNQIGVEASTLE